MVKVVGIRFKTGGKVYYFDPGELPLKKEEFVIVETARGTECGEVTQAVHSVPDISITKPLKRVVRMADDVDVRKMRQNREDEKRAFTICEERIAKHKLEMKLIDVEYAFDRSKILFNFTAVYFALASSCAKLACAMKARCLVVLAFAGSRFAATAF